ncbi:hypothetical protein BH23VER1_BH23VER1_10990 [soil metagenome]
MRTLLVSICLLAFLGFPAFPVSAEVVINEIMFRPAGIPENPGEEFIELYNPTATPIDLGGYFFDRGVTIIIPAGTAIPAGGFLVVAADVATFRSIHPSVPGVVGGWAGTLSNSDETLRLVAPGGQAVDVVRYATEGEWATRIRNPADGGWDWQSLADGGGRSLELVAPHLDNDSGQNWRPSAGVGGTPGAPNSALRSNVPPLIKGVTHSPAVPGSGDPVTITCVLVDETPASLTATLHWRISAAVSPPFSVIPMAADGDGRFSATLPPHPDKSVIEFFVFAGDGNGGRAYPAPTSEGQNANALYQVDNDTAPPGQAIHRLVMTIPENTAFQNSSGGSNRVYNVTLISDLGSGERIRYQCGMRIRGASSRSHNPRPMRMHIPNDNRLGGISIFNLNPRYTYLQVLGAKLFQAAGIRTADAMPVQVRRNGTNHARNDTEFDFGRWAMVERLAGDFVDNHWPLDDGGNLYKKVRPDRGWAYRMGNSAAYQADGFSKENSKAADDWSDLDGLMAAMNASPASPTYLANIEAVANTDQWMRWFAAATIMAHAETNISTGADDDYSLYSPAIGGRFELIPHDLDTILGLGDGSRITNPAHTLFDMVERGDVLGPLVPFFALPSIRTRYLTALRDLAATVFDPASFDPLVDDTLDGWVDAATINAIKSFNAARSTFVRNQTEAAVGVYVPTAPTTNSTLAGLAISPLVISEILADNRAATPLDGTFPPLVEIRNLGTLPIDLGGKSLTDDPATPAKFVFPPGTPPLAPGAYFVVAGGTPPPGGGSVAYLGFGLDARGGQLLLFDSAAVGQPLLDIVEFGPQIPDFSVGRTGAGAGMWALVNPSLGAPNSPQALGSPSALRINEWLANPDFRFDDDFIELYNPGPRPVALGGAAITDDAINFPARATLPPLSFIAPGGFLTFVAGGGGPAGSLALPFGLSSTGDRINLIGANGRLIDRRDFGVSFRDLSTGGIQDGAPVLAQFDFPTPGLSNSDRPAAMTELLSFLRITELHYDPQGESATEFVELHNIGPSTLSLGGVRFTKGISFEFPPGSTLEPGAFVVVVENLAAFEAAYGAGVPVAGAYGGKLNNAGETLALTLPRPYSAHILQFRYENFWDSSTGGGGSALVIRTPSETHPRDWQLGSSWIASIVAGGTPGTGTPPQITSPDSASGSVATPFLFTLEATFGPSTFASTPLPAGLSLDPATGLISGSPEQPGMTAVSITATNTYGSTIAELTLDILPQPAPAITSRGSVSTVVDFPFSYQITASNNPSAFSATGGPGWLILDPQSGVLSGQPPSTGEFPVTIGATNTGGTGTALLVISVISDPIAQATDSPFLAFTRTGDADWFLQEAVTFDGIDAAQSGDIGNSGESVIRTQVVGPGTLTFWWRVSSEFNFDFLEFQLDGATVRSISGEVGWEEVSANVPEGTHTLTWINYKDFSISTGADAGWVDAISYLADTDLDGLPDWWEEMFFGDLSQGPSDDSDGDGQSNLSEYFSGFDPSDPASVFALTAVDALPDGQFELTWNSVPDRLYQTQVSLDMRSWADVGEPLISDGASTTRRLDSPTGGTPLSIQLIDEASPARALIPSTNPGTLWQGGDEAAFAAAGGDGSWLSGHGGIGYEASPGSANSFVPFIGIDVINAQNFRTSVYGRYRFHLPVPPANVLGLDLRLRIDDGFVAFVNGTRVASLNAPGLLAWNSRATTDNPDPNALQLAPFPVATPFSYLREGENILAIQILNGDLPSSDLLAQPTLSALVSITSQSPTVFWRIVTAD